jgi:putative hemolysin
MELLILLGLIALNGLFAMSEIALVTARRTRLTKLAEDGDRRAAAALKLSEDPTAFLSTIQIGITSIGLLSGIMGEAVLAAPLSSWLQAHGAPEATAHVVATAIVVVVVTYVAIVIGELVPKRIGQLRPEAIARLVARPMQTLAMATRPFVAFLSFSTGTLLRMLRVKQNLQSNVTEEEIHAMLEEGSESGAIEEHEHEMVRNVFLLDDRKLGSLLVPRSNVIFIDIRRPVEENLRRLIESEHSRLPVCEDGLDKILGVIDAKQVLATAIKGQAPDFTSNLTQGVFVPETLTGYELLQQFRSKDTQMAFVIDEYGGIEGIVTLQDLLESVVGQWGAGAKEDAPATQRADGSWLLDGSIPTPDVKGLLELRHLPQEDKTSYHTLSGMIMALLGRIPKPGDSAVWEEWRLEVVDMDGNRIDKVLASSNTQPR